MGARGHVTFEGDGCASGNPCVVVVASATSPKLWFAPPSGAGTYTLSELHAEICERSPDAGSDSDCTALRGELVVRDVVRPCVGFNEGAVYSDPCGRLEADIKVTARAAEVGPAASGEAKLVYQDPNAQRWCGGGGGGLGHGAFAP